MRKGLRAARLRLSLAAISVSVAPVVFAQTDVTWATPSTGNWNLGTNWTGGAVPNNGTPVGVTYNVFIDGAQGGASTVNINSTQHFTISNLTVSAGDQLNVNSGGSLTLAGDGTIAAISNAGTISNSGTMNMTATTVTLSGGGSVTMTSGRFLGAGTLNNVNNTIVGSGTFLSGLNNAGLIHATGAMHFDPAGTTAAINSGTIQATGATATLSGSGGPAYTNTGGYILAKEAGTLMLTAGAIINGGTLGSEGSGIVTSTTGASTTVTDVTLLGNFATATGNNFFINGVITNLGTYTVNSNSDLELGGGSVGLLGGGTVILSASNSGFIGVGTLVSNNLVRGQGALGGNQTAIINNGTITADIAVSTLTIDSGAGNSTNNGQIIAQNGATLTITGNGGGTYSNTGTIASLNASTVALMSGAFISGGTLTTSGSGIISLVAGHDGTLESLTNLGNFQMANSNNLYLGGTINNVGYITVAGATLSDIEVAAGSTTLSGGGTIHLNNVNSRLHGAGTLINQNNVIQGQGTIGVNSTAITNNGTIASSVGGTLSLDPGAGNFTNNLLLSASSGTLSFSGNGGGTFINNGTIQALNGATVAMVSGTLISGGTLTTSGSGIISLVAGHDATLESLTNLGNFQMANSNNLYLGGTINNVGSITVAGASASDMESNSAGTLTGGGTIHLNNVNSRIHGSGTLFNSNNTIRGIGALGVNALAITNNGTIIFDVAGTSTVDPPSVANAFVHNGALFASVGTTIFTGSGGGAVSGSGSYNVAGGATMSLSAGIQFTGGPIANNGLLSMSAGTVSLGAITGTGTTTISTGTVSAAQVLQGTLSLSGSSSRLSINPNGTTAATSRVDSLTITTNARLDLSDNALVVDYAAGTPFSTIRGQIITGYAAGAWNGVGINSSSAAANPTTRGLGYAESSDVGIAGSFRGQAFTGDAVLVMYTLLGDANLDRTVDSMDFNRLTTAYGITANANWGQADFDYNGKVNTRDFNHLAGNFGQTLAGSLPAAALGAAVPEPAALALLPMLLPLRRRR